MQKSAYFAPSAWYITDRAEKSPNLPYLSKTSIREVKMPKIDTLDALEEHEEHEDDYQTNSNKLIEETEETLKKL